MNESIFKSGKIGENIAWTLFLSKKQNLLQKYAKRLL